MPVYQDVSPTGHIDPSGDWQNPANAYDGNWETTYAANGIFAVSEADGNWTNWLTLTFAALMYIDRIRFKYWTKDIHIQILNNDTGAWEDVIKAEKLGVQYTVIIPTTYSDRVRVRGSETEKVLAFFELNAEQVIPDPPAPPPPPPNPPEVYQTEKKETQGQPTQGTTRVRTLHRRTQIGPWIV